MAEPDKVDQSEMVDQRGAEATRHGPGRVLILVYGVFARDQMAR